MQNKCFKNEFIVTLYYYTFQTFKAMFNRIMRFIQESTQLDII